MISTVGELTVTC